MAEHPLRIGRSVAVGRRSNSTPLDLLADLNTRLATLEADSLAGGSSSVMKARAAVGAVQEPHSDIALAIHLAYMAELLISIAEADARMKTKSGRRKDPLRIETRQQ